MATFKLRELRTLANSGAAENITNYSFDDINVLRNTEDLQVVGMSPGMYGVSGALLKGTRTGKHFVILGRTAALFMLV